MASKKIKDQHRQTFESSNTSGKRERYIRIFDSLWESEAYLDLSPTQRELLRICHWQYMGNEKKSQPGIDYPDIAEFADSRCFYCNKALIEKRKLYPTVPTLKRNLPKDLYALGVHGFIELLSDGEKTKSKSIYKLSPRWAIWEIGKDFIADGTVIWRKAADKGNVSMGGGYPKLPF